MDLIKKFCLDKGRVGVAIVCLLMLCIGLISSNAGETYAYNLNNVPKDQYSCPLGGDFLDSGNCELAHVVMGVSLDVYPFGSGFTGIGSCTDYLDTIGYGHFVDYDFTKNYCYYDSVMRRYITYDANGGSFEGGSSSLGRQYFKYHSESLYYDDLDSIVPTRDGYIFDGWYTDTTYKTKIYKTTEITGSTTVYARWIIPQVASVSFNPGNKGYVVYDGVTYKEGITYSKDYVVGNSYSTLPSANRVGYKFKGWYNTDGNKIISSDIVPAGISFISLSAEWNPITYTVSYNGNGNTGGSTASSSHTYDDEKNLTANGFEKIGYTFTGWNTYSDGSGKAYSDNVPIVNLRDYDGANIILWAQWTKNSSEPETPKTYTVTYNSNGGTGTMASSTYTEGVSKKLTKNTFTKTGYTFTGWNTKEDGSGTSYKDEESVTISEKSTLFAQWKANTYTVKYNANEGTGTMSSSKYTYDKELALKKNTFTREEYIFDGWNTKGDGSGTDYKDGQSVKNLTDKNNDTITLYAQWIDEDSKENENPGTGTDGDGTENENPDSGTNGDTSNNDEKVEDSNGKDDKEDENPPTGSLATILVSMIGIVALVCFVFYYKKVRV